MAGGPCRREPDTAVTEHGSGDAVPARRSEIRVPRHLTVVVRVNVDEPGCDDKAIGVEFALRTPADPTDLDDPTVGHRDIGGTRWRTRAVDDGATANHEIEHTP